MVKCIFYFVPRRQLAINIDYKDTIRDIKRKIYLDEGLPESLITLVYAKGVKSIKEAVEKEYDIRANLEIQAF